MDMFDMVDSDAMSLAGNIKKVQCPTLIMGVQSDILFPIQQQREVVDILKGSGNESISYYELNAKFGHDTFLIDVNGVTGAIRGHLWSAVDQLGVEKHRCRKCVVFSR